MRADRPIPATLVALLLWACGNGGGTTPAVDAAAPVPDGPIPIHDAAPGSDAPTPLTWVDFTITGCASGPVGAAGPQLDAGTSGDAGVPDPCVGEAPLQLAFNPLAPGMVDVYLWSFGDSTPDGSEAAPVHVFAEPGSYTVSLTVGGPGGTANTSKPVLVTAARLGAACDSDSQCASGTCVCDGATPCDAGAPSLCSTECSSTSPCSEGVCADLDPASVSAPQDWQRSLCLPACTQDSDCRSGLTCRDLRRGDGSGWVKACFAAGVLAEIGHECLDATGAPRHEQCASGLCQGFGARGTCSAPCTAGSCPESAACATFIDGAIGSRCVARCDVDTLCDADPWLACSAPGGTGGMDFTVDETPAGAGYCAPKSCTGPGECGPDGQCTDGFCGP